MKTSRGVEKATSEGPRVEGGRKKKERDWKDVGYRVLCINY
jgi:hypothetical protein